VEGREHLPTDRACIALMKHSSSWETFAQAALLPPQVWVLKRELMWIPFVGWGLRLLRCIAIDRGGGGVAVRQMIEQGRTHLADGKWIVVFPEGTRMAPGQTRRYGVGPPIETRGRDPREINEEAQRFIEAHSGPP
jgi:1-acyl-sn-glycerol-3-phosphate acyltransferase